MTNQIYYEDIEVGSEIPPTKKVATTRILVQWAGASGDFNPLHYEADFARSQGLVEPVVHGALKRAWLGQLVTNWIGEEGFLKKFSCQFRKADWPRKMKTGVEPMDGETWLCKGKVTKKYVENSQNMVECEIWVENGKGEITTPGTVLVILPSRRSI
ncbi:MAG: MaoC/PaaZ C-terminal domain-containing protein [Anaerolineaceae bacterium]|nr:MaoC/PaaZ C-terminal domain-containing protein [Anaerolineaceae bacterium]